MVVGGTNYKCIYKDNGAYGRCFGNGIWSNSNFSKPFGIPGPKKMMNSYTTTPFPFLDDGVFGLNSYLMKPYPQRELTMEKRI